MKCFNSEKYNKSVSDFYKSHYKGIQDRIDHLTRQENRLNNKENILLMDSINLRDIQKEKRKTIEELVMIKSWLEMDRLCWCK